MKSYRISVRQIEWSSLCSGGSSSVLTVWRQYSLGGPKTRLFKTTLAGWWYFLLICPWATAWLQLKSTLFPPCHIRERKHYWWGWSGFDSSLSARVEEERLVHTYRMCICVLQQKKLAFLCVRACVCVSVLNKASRSWQRLSGGTGGGGGELSHFFSFDWRKCQHASVCLATGTKSSHTPTH